MTNNSPYNSTPQQREVRLIDQAALAGLMESNVLRSEKSSVAYHRAVRSKVLPFVLEITFNAVWVVLPLLPLAAVLLSWLHGL